MTALLWWGLIQSVIMTIVIVLNGLGKRIGWFAGAAAQGAMIVFGYGVFGGETFLFLLIPMMGFLWNWGRQPIRDQVRKAKIINEWKANEAKRRAVQDALMPDIGKLTGIPVTASPFVPPGQMIFVNPETLDTFKKPEPYFPFHETNLGPKFTVDDDLSERMEAASNQWIKDWVKEYMPGANSGLSYPTPKAEADAQPLPYVRLPMEVSDDTTRPEEVQRDDSGDSDRGSSDTP